MENLKNESIDVFNAFKELTISISKYHPVSDKDRELTILGMFVIEGSEKAILTHAKRSLSLGSSRKEILGTIMCAIPIIGIAKTNKALNIVIQMLSVADKNE